MYIWIGCNNNAIWTLSEPLLTSSADPIDKCLIKNTTTNNTKWCNLSFQIVQDSIDIVKYIDDNYEGPKMLSSDQSVHDKQLKLTSDWGEVSVYFK